MNNPLLLGLDGGATKILAQTCTIDPRSSLIIPKEEYHESNYRDSHKFNSGFIPIDLAQQKKEAKENNYSFSDQEINQSASVIETIVKVIESSAKEKTISKVGLCFPGIKTANYDGISIMANGPRNINMLSMINKMLKPKLDRKISIKTIYNDSECCVIGEWKSSIGKLRDCKNAIYVGGGTGIADGIILNNKIVDKDIERSWELIMPSGESVEQCLSLGGMLSQWNNEKEKPIQAIVSLFDHAVSGNNFANSIIEKAEKAFDFLIERRMEFFQSHNSKPEKIVIGQRLGNLLTEKNNPLAKLIFQNNHNVLVEISTDRRTAALGAAYKAHEKQN
jgi:predicted NBD/HSP70 family sugar kinase